jgi:hypothetical protein
MTHQGSRIDARPDGALVVPAMRWLLGFAAALVFLAGVQLFLFPLETDTRFAWTIPAPMTAVFLGASYWSAVGLELSGALSRRWTVARVAVPAVFVFTALTFVATVIHLHKFHLARELPAVTRAVAWGWIGVYAVVPVLMALAWWLQFRGGTEVPPPSGLPPVLRGMLAVLAVGLLALGVALYVAPTWADAAWPWQLTPLVGMAVGAWTIGLAVAAGHAWVVNDAPSLRPIGVTGVLFGALQTIALLRYGDGVDWRSVPGVGFVVMLAAITVVGVWLLVLGRRPRSAAPA